MSRLITRTFKVDAQSWESFQVVCQSMGKSTGEVLRELIAHAEAALQGIQSGQVGSFDADMPEFLKREFPQLQSYDFRKMARVLMEAARRMDKK